MTAERPRILVVDDEPGNIRVLARALGDGYDIRFATSGEQALATVADREIDLILLDVVMPGLDGFEVLHRLKNDDASRGVPVIFVTAMSEVDDETRGLALGAVDYIAKPIRGPIVRARVNTHLELKRQRDLLERHAFIDGLTGIANRRRFDQSLATAWRNATEHSHSLAVVLGDVDYFKQFNDVYGHSPGDEALRQVAKCLREVFRRPDDLVARYGGEEFVVLLENPNIEGLRDRLADLRTTIRAMCMPHSGSKVDEILTLSAGAVLCLPTRETTVAEFVEGADAMLYAAKEGGRDRCHIDDRKNGQKLAYCGAEWTRLDT